MVEILKRLVSIKVTRTFIEILFEFVSRVQLTKSNQT